MIVTPVDYRLDLQRSDLVRSPGVHASDLYGSLFKALDPKRYNRGGDPPHELMMLGSAFEDRFEKILLWNGVNAERPDALMSPEGIGYSPDLIVYNGVTRVGEMKLTSMDLSGLPTTGTFNSLPVKFDKYLVQMKLYAHWLDLHHGLLVMCSIYRPWAPVLRLLELEWTDQELHENYQMLMNHGRHEKLLP